jgi:hypothetical protein
VSSVDELIEALFGGAGTLTAPETAFGLLAAAGVVLFILQQKSCLVLVLVSPEIGRTAGIDVARLNLMFLETWRFRCSRNKMNEANARTSTVGTNTNQLVTGFSCQFQPPSQGSVVCAMLPESLN